MYVLQRNGNKSQVGSFCFYYIKLCILDHSNPERKKNVQLIKCILRLIRNSTHIHTSSISAYLIIIVSVAMSFLHLCNDLYQSAKNDYAFVFQTSFIGIHYKNRILNIIIINLLLIMKELFIYIFPNFFIAFYVVLCNSMSLILKKVH